MKKFISLVTGNILILKAGYIWVYVGFKGEETDRD